MTSTLFALFTTLSTADAARPTTLARDWSYVLSFLTECPTTWNDLINHDSKSAIAGADAGINEYVIGYTESVYLDEASMVLYDSDDDPIGAAVADPTGAESYSGDILDIEPVVLLTSCSSTAYPRYFVRVYTTDNPTNGFLAIVP